MVDIRRSDQHFIFEVKGMHKLWAFKSELKIPVENVTSAHQDLSLVSGWKGFRAPGTSVPFLITAGTFHLEGDKIFWDVMNKEKSIVVELRDEKYKRLIIEVEDPAKAIELLSR